MKNSQSKTWQRVCHRIKLKQTEIKHWQQIAQNMYLPVDPQTGLIEQFDSYFKKQSAIIEKTGKDGLPLLPEKYTWENIAKTQLIKQADIVLLTYLLPEQFSPKQIKLNYEFYEKRTMHKSSLSPSVYAIMGTAIGDHRKAYRYFMHTALIDLHNIHSNTRLGLHAAAAGGAWNTVIHGFAGMRVRLDSIQFNPWLPPKWKQLAFSVLWQRVNLQVTITRHKAVFFFETTEKIELPIRLGEQDLLVFPNKKKEVNYR